MNFQKSFRFLDKLVKTKLSCILLINCFYWNVFYLFMEIKFRELKGFKDFFDLKNARYDLRSKKLLKLPETSTSGVVHKLSVSKVA